MSTRGPYAKGIVKRQEILDAALAVIAEHGYSGATVRHIADRVGLSQNGLLHYFGSKDALFVDVLRRRDELDAGSFGPDADGAAPDDADAVGPTTDGADAELQAFATRVVDLVRHNADVPGLVHLFAQLTADASDRDHPAHGFLGDRYATIRATATRRIARLQAAGQVRPDLDPAQAASMLWALVDGLQNQWLYDRDVDMAAGVATFLALLAPTR